jgi:hypothetical protein
MSLSQDQPQQLPTEIIIDEDSPGQILQNHPPPVLLPDIHAVNQNIPQPAVDRDSTIIEYLGVTEMPNYFTHPPLPAEPFNAYRQWFYPAWERLRRNA